MEVSVKCEARHICIRLSGELDHHSAVFRLLRRLDQEIESCKSPAYTADAGSLRRDLYGQLRHRPADPGPAADARSWAARRCLARCRQHRPAECWMRRANVI